MVNGLGDPYGRRYGYYFLSSMGVRVSQGVKKSITVIQLIQASPRACGKPRPKRLFCSPTFAKLVS